MYSAAQFTYGTGHNCAAPEGSRFGAVLRHKRQCKGLGLRRFAQLVGVSPTYISLIERGHVDPPTAQRVARMAQLLDEPADALIALAGLPEDLVGILCARPDLATLLREVRGLTRTQLDMLFAEVRGLDEENRRAEA
ncbi:MAG: helix-turn-helix transcriptional regulator [Planctomycetes bacterium]|nr:helix-turn-helix transcriptional regulator [Planctomycetota bacterium]